MGISDAIVKLCDEMRRIGGGDDFELALGELVGRFQEAHLRRMRDAQAADLLALGRTVAAERLGVRPSTVYKMAHRHRRFSTLDPAA